MTKAYEAAVSLLARREHSYAELKTKLKSKGYEEASIDEALLRCKAHGLQCDRRYAQSLQRTRFSQGFGEKRLRHDLMHAEVDAIIIDDVLNDHKAQALEQINRVWHKKYKGVKPHSFEEVQKQKQFLHYRGFSSETIRKFFVSLQYEDE